MPQQIINNGESGLLVRTKINSNFTELYNFTTNPTDLSAVNIYVGNDLTVVDTVSAKYYQGTILDWMTLVRGYKTIPTLNI